MMKKARRERFSEQLLDPRLDSYSTAAGAALSMEARRPRGRSWAAYAAAAGAALSMVPSGEALATLIDMDGRGPAEFALSLNQYRVPGYAYGTAQLIPLYSNQILGTGYYGRVARLPGSYVVGGGSYTYTWGKPRVLWRGGYSRGTYGTYSGGSGNWAGSQTGFAGVQFKTNGNTYFGWIQLHVSTSYKVATGIGLLGFGYNCNPGQRIHVGDPTPDCDGTAVPAPGGLALLAAGAAGLLAWRQRKKTAGGN